jgi:site-specific DNA-methyltransferase (cytosine-N4-specific)
MTMSPSSPVSFAEPYIKTPHGAAFLANSLDVLREMRDGSVNLIITSPPFGLVRKKDYGNEDAERYVEWFRPFAEQFKRILRADGSLVIDIGGAWKPGQPTRSLYHFKLLIALCEDFDFHLAQEFYWWNPSKLPTPAEWVTVRRIRVKDAVNSVYWLSPTSWPKASNRRVLQPYSESMQQLLKHGYRAKKRPSGHDISKKFSINNGAAIPPNLISIANTESNSFYLRYCQEHGLDVHPALYPAALPEYFVRMLTDTGDLVVDPFAGSCVTGEVCERLERSWVCVEILEDYLKGARGRFIRRINRKPENAELWEIPKDFSGAVADDKNYYKAARPDILWNGTPRDTLPSDGGRRRDASTRDRNRANRVSEPSKSSKPLSRGSEKGKRGRSSSRRRER